MSARTPPPSPPRRRRVGRALLLALGALLGLLLLSEALGWPFLRAPLEQRLGAALQRDIHCGAGFKLRLLGPLRLHCDELRLGSPETSPALLDEQRQRRPLLHARGVFLQLPWSVLWALRRGEPDAWRFDVIEAQQLELNLARAGDGRANWRFGPPRPAQPEHNGAGPDLPDIGRLLVREARVRVEDRPQQLQLDAHAGLREDGGQARFEARGEGQWRGQPWRAQLVAGGLVPLVDADARATPVPLQLQWRSGRTALDLDGRVTDLLRLQSLQGQFRLAAASLAEVATPLGLTLPHTAPLEMNGQLSKQARRWQAQVQRLHVGSSRLRGHFDYDAGAAPPRLDGTLAGARLALADLAPAFGAPGTKGAAPRPAGSGRVLPQREFNLPELGQMQARVRLDLDQAHLGSGLLEDLRPLQGVVTLQDRVLVLDELRARTADGEVRGRLQLDARADPPRWDADLRWAGIELDRFVRPRNPRAAAPGRAAPGYVSGKLSGHARLHGSGRSTAAMLASLDGQVTMSVRNGRLSHLLVEAVGLDVAQGLGLAVSGDRSLPLHCAVARLQVRDGLVRPEVAVLDTADSTLLVEGTLSLARERLALVVKAHPKDVSPLTLRAPLHVEGSFAQPQLRLEKTRIGLRLAASALLAAVNPLAALLPLIDLGEPEQTACRQALDRR